MTDRSEGARVIARRVAERVGAVAPVGLGRWGPAWNIVEDPSRAFLDALNRWEAAADPSPTAEEVLRDAVREAAEAVVRAWTVAAARWEAAGRPVEEWKPAEPVEAAR
jgi:hypothetical protein